DALIRAKQRGLQVRVVMESNAMDGKQPQRLMDNGIPIIGDQLESLMHNKYWIIDETEVWTGSLNLTNTGTYDDHNNILMLRNPGIVRNYLTDFEEMFAGNFGDAKRRNTPYPFVETSSIEIENYFSPEDKTLAHLVTLVNSAQERVLFLAYSFTNDALAEAMIERAEAGVEVRGVMERQQVESNQGGEYERMRQAGLDVRLDGLEGQMHHKVIIVDGRTVVTGSYNFTNGAERYNEENLLIIHDEALAEIYEAEFGRIYARAIP
ncbi:MAG: phospholipase D-like domain-containing protein, partial [Anaerolineales bacterium]